MRKPRRVPCVVHATVRRVSERRTTRTSLCKKWLGPLSRPKAASYRQLRAGRGGSQPVVALCAPRKAHHTWHDRHRPTPVLRRWQTRRAVPRPRDARHATGYSKHRPLLKSVLRFVAQTSQEIAGFEIGRRRITADPLFQLGRHLIDRFLDFGVSAQPDGA